MTETKTDKLTFELPKDLAQTIDQTRMKLQDYVRDARDEFEQNDGESHKDADEITAWFDELDELADNLDSMALEPDVTPDGD